MTDIGQTAAQALAGSIKGRPSRVLEAAATTQVPTRRRQDSAAAHAGALLTQLRLTQAAHQGRPIWARAQRGGDRGCSCGRWRESPSDIPPQGAAWVCVRGRSAWSWPGRSRFRWAELCLRSAPLGAPVSLQCHEASGASHEGAEGCGQRKVRIQVGTPGRCRLFGGATAGTGSAAGSVVGAVVGAEAV